MLGAYAARKLSQSEFAESVVQGYKPKDAELAKRRAAAAAARANGPALVVPRVQRRKKPGA